jgi:hypothetical protein
MDFMNNCKHYRKLISRYIDNDLIDEEKQLLTGHFSSCMECMNVLNGYSIMRTYIREGNTIPLQEKTEFPKKRSIHPWSHFFPVFNSGIRLAAISIVIVFLLGGWLLLRVERNDQAPLVVGNESAGMMNTPLGAMVYYEEFAGKTVSEQFTRLQNVRIDPDGRNGSSAFKNIVGYESPLFHDNSLLQQRYNILNSNDAF